MNKEAARKRQKRVVMSVSIHEEVFDSLVSISDALNIPLSSMVLNLALSAIPEVCEANKDSRGKFLNLERITDARDALGIKREFDFDVMFED